MGNAMQRNDIGMKESIMGVNNVKSHAFNFTLSKPGKTNSSEVLWKRDDRNFVKPDQIGVFLPLIGKHMHLAGKVPGNAFR